MRRNRKPARYADEGHLRTYRIVSDASYMGSLEEEVRLMGILHASRQTSHVKFVTTPRGLIEQHLTTDMSLPYMGEKILIEDITPKRLKE